MMKQRKGLLTHTVRARETLMEGPAKDKRQAPTHI